MAQNAVTKTFRTTFKTIEKDLLRWFPGHMDKGIKQMQQKLKLVDCIIEVHDARIPFSGRNADFKHYVTGIKPHILVMNKKDMIEKELIPEIKKYLEKEGNHVLFTNCKNHMDSNIRKVLPLAEELILKSERFNRNNAVECNMMIIGVPNVGKSSFINCLRNYHLKKRNASAVGAVPGITRSVLNRIKINDDPLFYLYDTPGILSPNIPDIEAGLKQALCATLQDHMVGEVIIADYLLYWLNKHNEFSYVDYFELNSPTDNIMELLIHIAKKYNKTIKFKSDSGYTIKPDFLTAARYLIKAFRTGDLGKFMLDIDLINSQSHT